MFHFARWTPCITAHIIIAATLHHAHANVTSQADAQYQSAHPGVLSQSIPHPPTNVERMADPAMDGFSYSRGLAESRFVESLFATLGVHVESYSRTGGWDPNYGPPDAIFGSAANYATNRWKVTSESLSPGTLVEVVADINTLGDIAASQIVPSETPGVSAQADSIFTVDHRVNGVLERRE